MGMPLQKPGRSKQDYGTPWELIKAIELRYGSLGIDLAASEGNAKCAQYYDLEMNSLEQPWHLHTTFRDWLNPPFEDFDTWAGKCAAEAKLGWRGIMLSPASVGSEWFRVHVCGETTQPINARVVTLSPRIVFEGCKDPYPKDCCDAACVSCGPAYPKDCMLSLWNIPGEPPGFEIWRWK